MPLQTNAITSVANVKDYMGLAVAASPAFDIYHDGTSGTATAATVTITDTTVVLIVTGGANAGTSTLTLSDAANDTMAELVAVITALNKGWQVSLLSGSSVSSTLLIPKAATSVLLQANTYRATFDNAELIENLINRASDAMERFCDTPIKQQTDLRYWIDGRGDMDLLIPAIPLTAVHRIAYGSAPAFSVKDVNTTDIRATVEVRAASMVLSRFASTGTETATSLTFATYPTTNDLVTAINAISGSNWTATTPTVNSLSLDLHRRGGMDALRVNADVTYPDQSSAIRHVDENSSIVHLAEGADYFGDGCGYRNQFGRYNYLAHVTAGWSTIPDDIEQFCIEMVQTMWNNRGKDQSLQSESLGDYSYSRAATPAEANSVLLGMNVSRLDLVRRRGF